MRQELYVGSNNGVDIRDASEALVVNLSSWEMDMAFLFREPQDALLPGMLGKSSWVATDSPPWGVVDWVWGGPTGERGCQGDLKGRYQEPDV